MSYLDEPINMRSLMRECLECGQEFIADESGEECCSDRCAAAYYGWDDGYEFDNYNAYDDDYDDLEDDFGDEAEYYGTNWN